MRLDRRATRHLLTNLKVTVMSKSNYDIAHDFAYGYESGRSCNMFIDDDCIYSYGYHFCIAKRVGRGTLLMTTQGYSQSTAKHISYVERATGHYNKIYCYDPRASHEENQRSYLEDIEHILPQLDKARKPEKYLHEIQIVCERAKKYCEFFGIKMDKDLAKFVQSEDLNKTNEEYMAELQRRAYRERRKQMKEKREALKKWQNHETNWPPVLDYQELRLNPEKNRIETTMRVEIPFELGRVFYERLKAGEVQLGEQLLYYTVRRLTDTEISVGCHTFKRKTLMDFGKRVFC